MAKSKPAATPQRAGGLQPPWPSKDVPLVVAQMPGTIWSLVDVHLYGPDAHALLVPFKRRHDCQWVKRIVVPVERVSKYTVGGAK